MGIAAVSEARGARRCRLTVSGAEGLGRGEDTVLVVVREPARLLEVCRRERLRER